MKNLGERIKFYRGKHGLTQEAFSNMCGIGRVTLIRIERGVQDPTAKTLYAIESILKTDENNETE